jgi:hypothetical protein
MQKLFKPLSLNEAIPLQVHNNNQGAIKTMINCHGNFHRLSKHYNIKMKYTMELINQSIIYLHWCKGTCMPADLLTKPLRQSRLQYLLPLHHLSKLCNTRQSYDLGITHISSNISINLLDSFIILSILKDSLFPSFWHQGHPLPWLAHHLFPHHYVKRGAAKPCTTQKHGKCTSSGSTSTKREKSDSDKSPNSTE